MVLPRWQFKHDFTHLCGLSLNKPKPRLQSLSEFELQKLSKQGEPTQKKRLVLFKKLTWNHKNKMILLKGVLLTFFQCKLFIIDSLSWVFFIMGVLRAFTSENVKKCIFYILKYYFIYFINSFNNTPNISIFIFTYNLIKII